MIDTNDMLIKDISHVNSKILDLIDNTKNIPKLIAPNFSNLQLVCENIASELEKNIIRVAVVGTVKSGKSTFVNSLFRKDYLKRGAGVLTSIVTRVRNSSHHDQATLFLKTWKEINEDIEQSMSLIPYSNKFINSQFDIRQQKDRRYLERVLNKLKQDPIENRIFNNKSYTLLSSYLKGYKEVYKYISDKNKSINFRDKDLILHQNFVTSDHLSVYLTDVLLEIEGKTLKNDIEIADCQGSDSLNPLHLSMTQNYLNMAHLIIYVISSRTGVKEADIKFITLIKKMGILDNIIFVINVDLNEHNSVDDIIRLTSKTKEDLFFVNNSSLKIFTFSALHNLMLYNNSITISKTIFEFITQEYASFLNLFNKKLNSDRYFLLINNHIHKLEIISKSLESWIETTNYILINNTKKSKKIINDITISCSELLDLKTTIDKSIQGSAEQIKKELFLNIDRFFGNKYDGIIYKTIKFIHEWNFNFDNLNKNMSTSITGDLYKIFQNFKQEIDKYIYEIIHPDIVGFIREEEIKLVKHIESMSNFYSSMLNDIAKKYNARTKKLNLRINLNPSNINIKFNLSKTQVKLSPITFGVVKYHRLAKVEAIIYFYLKKGIQYLLRLINLNIYREQNLHVAIEKKSIEYIKKETKIAAIYHLKNQRENIKFQHIVCIIKMISDDIEQQISSQIDTNTIELDRISRLIHAEKLEKEESLKIIENIAKKSTKINNKIKQILLVISTIKKA